MLYFENDYSEGAHEKVLKHLIDTNMEQLSGYGHDTYCERAKQKIKEACECPDAEIFFISGGTQTNQIVIDAMLQGYEGVIAATTGHVSGHEAGAIEFTGHKVLTIPQENGKISAEELKKYLEGNINAFSGNSGVGKSTLVNALAGTEIMKTGEIREKDAKGRHTTTYREMIELPNNVVIIDTPGMREIGLCDVDEGIDDTFEDIAKLATQCRFRDCTHTNEPRCAVRQALENGQLSKERFELYRSLHVESRKSADMKAIAKARKALNKTRKK